jgi:hypothetical protein
MAFPKELPQNREESDISLMANHSFAVKKSTSAITHTKSEARVHNHFSCCDFGDKCAPSHFMALPVRAFAFLPFAPIAAARQRGTLSTVCALILHYFHSIRVHGVNFCLTGPLARIRRIV